MKEKTNFGRGLSDLLQENLSDVTDSQERIMDLDIDKIIPNAFQPRKYFNEEKIKELSESIKEQGVFQPIIVKKINDNYIIVAGERRYRASKLIGNKTIPAIIRQYEKAKVAEIALVENIQREALSPVEEAESYLMIIREAEITQDALAKKIGKSRSHITNMLGILNLPESVLSMVSEGMLSAGHAKALSKLSDFKQIQELTKLIIKKNLSVRDLETLIRNEKKKQGKTPESSFDPLKKTEEKFKVEINLNEGKLEINGDPKILEKILKKLAA
ncbi:MAG: ParB/RepB/Spo0J family partition protein [Erysipelotrichales bacterium]|nr:ParB/RepB/Spo0J family partition protein [Erysipelotrichales bacterium]